MNYEYGAEIVCSILLINHRHGNQRGDFIWQLKKTKN